MGLDLEIVCKEVEKHVGPPPETKMIGNIPYTPRVKKVLALAGKEAQALHHPYVGTEHILLGLLREGEGVAARVLKSLEVDRAQTRNEILKALDPNFTPPESEAEFRQEGDEKDVKTPALRAFGRDLDRVGEEGRAGSCDRSQGRNRTRDSDPVPAHQKQPGTARGSRGWKDRHRRRVGSRNRSWQRAGIVAR